MNNISINLCFFFFALMSTNICAQTVSELSRVDDDTLVYAVVEVMPEYAEGKEAMYKFIATNIKYPNDSRRLGESGTVYVGFVINKEGIMRDLAIVKSVTPALDAEALRVVSLLTSWRPGMQSGKSVNVKFVLPIKFRLPAAGHPDGDFSNTIFQSPEQMPVYPGGDDALRAQIEADLKSSGRVKVKKSLGFVYVRCVIEKDGSISTTKIVKSINFKYDNEALRVIGNLAKFTPGMNGGSPVRTAIIIPIEIK